MHLVSSANKRGVHVADCTESGRSLIKMINKRGQGCCLAVRLR